jgi:hypothetical protein
LIEDGWQESIRRLTSRKIAISQFPHAALRE